MALKIAQVLINTLNDYTEPHRYMCDELKLGDINWVQKLTPNQNLLKFNKNADLDGFVADLSGKMVLKFDKYQIKLTTLPGNSVFEATVTYYIDNDKWDVKMTDISRINMYGRQARCVENDLPDLRKYCYCKD